ncbi:acyltransferase [Roseateles sp. DAIF2]|uniref:acyltransferase family protein n=1 Tax=Roseateles sp. DAIF2 TaxID=2714952 RepID=UPI0018A28575|nr:acyltransferase family protein [Roseateles sp. DAIF2]QPF76338.1 acyltransferase [Roseateles sp. DAIF2]
MSTEYRPEVDGLRAIAVLSVMLFHADIPGFTGGYVGVDIFFVISGYLITGILLRAVEARQFSIAQFYERRIRRIFPALFVVLAASTLCAGLLLFANELANFGKSLFATSLFYANYHFMHDTGYFATPAGSKPLLHMWSLAVEEQFYLLFPLYVYAAWRWFRRGLLPLTVLLSLLSFAYSLWLIERSPDQAFYSAPARAWELMVGSLLAMGLQRWPQPMRLGRSQLLAGLGLLALLLPIGLYTEATPFPAGAALPPVLGSALLIWAAATPGNAVARLLSLPPVRFTGLISYSLYLWHWPVFMFYKTYAIQAPGALETGLLLLATFALATLTWRFVERPFRRGGGARQRRQVLIAGAAAMGVGICCGALLVLGKGLPGRFDPEIGRILAVADDAPLLSSCQEPQGHPGLRLCSAGAAEPAHASFVVWGDSHAEALLPAIDASARAAGAAGLVFVRGGCPPLLGVRQTLEGFRDCARGADAFIRYLADHPELKRVILVSRWAVYATGERFRREPGHELPITDDQATTSSLQANLQVFERGLARSLDQLAALKREVVLVTQVPEAEYRIPAAMARARHLGRQPELAPLRDDYRERQAPVEQAFERQRDRHRDLVFIRPEQVLCVQERCTISVDGLPIYRDSNHLSASRARALAPLFDPLFAPGGAGG